MTFEETAKYLKTGESTLYKMTGEGKIPADTKNLSAIKTRLIGDISLGGGYKEKDD